MCTEEVVSQEPPIRAYSTHLTHDGRSLIGHVDVLVQDCSLLAPSRLQEVHLLDERGSEGYGTRASVEMRELLVSERPALRRDALALFRLPEWGS